MLTIIQIEDKGQDFTKIICDESGKILETKPCQSEVWKGGYIPLYENGMFSIGKPCPIHHPPHIEFGFLKYNIIDISEAESND